MGFLASDAQLTTLEELEDHIADMPEEDLKELKIDVHNFLDYWPRGGRQYSVDSISHIIGVINCNGFTLSDQRGLQAVGVGIFPNLCLVNHDCWPNCTVILNHGNQTAVNTFYHSQRRIELRALGKIPEGQELTVGYVDFLNVSTDRQKLLKHQYFFDCTCDHCTHRTKDDLMTAAKEVDGQKPSEEVVKEVTEYSLKTLEQIEKSRTEGNYHEVVKLSRECLEKQEPVLGDTHLHHLRVLSVLSEVLSYLQYFEEAAGYARRMVEGYMICKAYAILLVTHGPTHAITKDLEAMRMQTEMELRMFRQNEYVYHTMREAALKNQPMSMMAEPVVEGIKSLFRKK